MQNLTGSKSLTRTNLHAQIWPVWSGSAQAISGWEAELVEQYRSLGLSHTEADRLFKVAYTALGEVLEGIDHHALAAVPLPEQVSMLSPRFDIDHLAAMAGINTAQAQSAVAMLVMDFVMQSQLPF